ncbi:KCNMA1 [Symbiodinium natans]|uniref:KCNMA1 protein n=1 Tax=Symbiodinium natans TaxID=878477 RepID=A0A812P9N3_9DINO|nr:KCNMA1 [Symbiodinium natans]
MAPMNPQSADQDFSPTTIPARLAIVFFIFGGVIFFGTETASFVDLLDEHSKGLGSYHNTSRSARHILVTGGGAHKFSSLMESFLLETLTGELEENQIPDVVFLSEQEYDEDLRSFVDYELASSLAAKVFFLRGSVMNLRDLERVMVESAVICLVLPDLDTESPQTEDSISVMMAMTMTRHFPGLRLRIMLLEPEGAKNAALLSIAFPRCFSAHEMKCAIFAKSTHVAGLVTFLSGLMQSRVDYSMDQLEKLSRGDKKNHWRLEYSRSLKKNLIGFVIAPHLADQAFPIVARRVYEESNGEVLLIAVAKAGKLLLNHNDFIHAGQVVVAIAARERHCLPFAECQGNVLKEWRFQFLHARSQRLKDESAQSVHHGKAGEVLLLHQPGLDRKWFLSKKPAGRSRTAAAGISSFQVDAMVREVSQDGHANLDKLRSFLEEAPSQMKGTDSAEARQRAAPDLEALKRHPRLTLLVVFHEEAQPIWPQLVCFLHYFHQQSELLDKAIIVLSGMQPPESILEEWEGQNCCFLVGKLTNTMNLRHAGVESAKNIIIMGRKRPQENVYLRTTALADAECVTIAGYIEQALAKKNALTGWRSSQSVLYEFGYTNSVFLTGHLFEVATRPAGRTSVTKGDVAIAVTESEDASHAKALSHTDSLQLAAQNVLISVTAEGLRQPQRREEFQLRGVPQEFPGPLFCACCQNDEKVEIAEVTATPVLPRDPPPEPKEEVKKEKPLAQQNLKYTAKISVKGHTSLGIEVDLTDEVKGPMITQVNQGAVKSFNDKYPEQALQKFDQISSFDDALGTTSVFEKLMAKLGDDHVALGIRRPREMVVTVSKPGGLGLKLDFKPSSIGAVVSELGETGLIKDWNAANPKDAVAVGDRILALNGEQYAGLEMVDKIKQAEKLELTILHY